MLAEGEWRRVVLRLISALLSDRKSVEIICSQVKSTVGRRLNLNGPLRPNPNPYGVPRGQCRTVEALRAEHIPKTLPNKANPSATISIVVVGCNTNYKMFFFYIYRHP